MMHMLSPAPDLPDAEGVQIQDEEGIPIAMGNSTNIQLQRIVCKGLTFWQYVLSVHQKTTSDLVKANFDLSSNSLAHL